MSARLITDFSASFEFAAGAAPPAIGLFHFISSRTYDLRRDLFQDLACILLQVFITFEGPEGAGKSSVANILAHWLRGRGQDVATTREPGGSHFGSKIRSILLQEGELSAEAELFLFLADRAEHVSKSIKPWLKEGKVVLCDRFADSTVVYQGYGRGLDLKMLRELNQMACRGLEPDLTFLLDISPETSLKRLTAMDRMDREPLEFHQRVREGFLTEAQRNPNRWVVIDASMPLDDVASFCKVKLEERQATTTR